VRSISFLSVALSIVIVFGVATAGHAATTTKKIHHHVRVVKAPTPQPRRVCDWIGPGARAVYRCTTVDPDPVHVTYDVTPQRICDWIGPGVRAVYRCR
jgi:hypothetical protein